MERARTSWIARCGPAILASGQLELMVPWTRSRWGADDLEMWAAAVRLLPATSPLRPVRRGRGGAARRANSACSSPSRQRTGPAPLAADRRNRCSVVATLRLLLTVQRLATVAGDHIARRSTMTVYAAPGNAGQPGHGAGPVRQLHRRRVVPPAKGQYFENPSPVTGQASPRSPGRTAEDIELALDAAHGAKRAWGKTSRHRARQHPEQDRRPHRGEPRVAWRSPRPGTTASRSARPWPPTSRWPSTTSATSPARSGPRRAASPRSTTTPSPTTSTSRSASSARSSRGTSRS